MKNLVQSDRSSWLVVNYNPVEVKTRPLECAVGVMAYNEEANLANLLEQLLRQKTTYVQLREIIVVASGCTDRTVEIARRFEAKNALVRVVEQPVREGKASAINQFLNYTTAEIVVLINGDTLPKEDTIEKLVEPFHDPLVGMTGGRAIPVNLKDRFMGFAVHLMWNLHDRVAQRTPKLGEVVAWRRFIGFVPPETAVDELSIEVLVTNMGYKLAYQPEAIVHNRGPETIRDFLKQRRRIHAGHLQILRLHGYRAATINNRTVLRSLLESISWQPRWLVWAAATVALEVAGRALGRYDYYTKKSYTIWQRIETTKNLISAEETDVA